MSTIDIIHDKRTTCNRRVEFGRRSAKVAFSLLVLIFVATTAFVYIVAPAGTSRREPYSVTATVVRPVGSREDASLEDASLDKSIFSDADLARAVGLISVGGAEERSHGLAGQPVESIRHDLRVKRTTAATLDGWNGSGRQDEISITYSGSASPVESCRLVDLLAEQTAHQDTVSRKAAATLEHKNAQEAADKARNELFKAQAQYDAFLNQHFTTNRASPPPAAAAPPAAVPSGTASSQPTPGLQFDRPDWDEVSKAATLNNPRWAELNNELAVLMARRAKLLDRMTPAHPEVQNVDLEIEDMERKVSSVPRELPRAGRDSLPPITPMPPDPADDLLLANAPPRLDAPPSPGAPASELQPRLEKEYRQKQKSLDTVRQQYNRLADLERETWQTLLNVADAEVIPAVCPPTVSAAAAGRSPWLVLLASIVGLCGAAGIGLFSTGISPPACFENVAEVRAELKTPVVGTMAGVDLPESSRHPHRSGFKHLALAASVLLFFAAAAVVAAMTMYLG